MILCALLAWSQSASQRADAAAQLHSAAEITARDFDDFLRMHGAVASVLAARRSSEGTLGDRARWSDRPAPPARPLPRVLRDARARRAGARDRRRSRRSRRRRSGPVLRHRARPGRADRVRRLSHVARHPAARLRRRALARRRALRGHRRRRRCAWRIPASASHGCACTATRRCSSIARGGSPTPASGLPLATMRQARRHARRASAARGGAGRVGDRLAARRRRAARRRTTPTRSRCRWTSGWRLLVLMPKATLDAELCRTIATMLGLLVAVAAGVLGDRVVADAAPLDQRAKAAGADAALRPRTRVLADFAPNRCRRNWRRSPTR